jgi:hypothetical protein
MEKIKIERTEIPSMMQLWFWTLICEESTWVEYPKRTKGRDAEGKLCFEDGWNDLLHRLVNTYGIPLC